MTTAFLRSPLFWSRVLGVAVVASVALSLAHLTWRLVGWDDGRSEIWTPSALPTIVVAAHGATPTSWTPFGVAAADGDLPVSTLGLVLRGVIFSLSGGSTAMISTGEGAAVQVFSVGDAPVGGAVIEAIEPDRVVLNVGGVRQALPLLKPTAVGGVPKATPAAPAVPAGPTVTPPFASATPQTPAAPAPGAMGSVGANLIPQSSPAGASALGVTSTGQGYVVGPDSAPQLLRAGLRPGDVVRSVDGVALGNPETDRGVFERAAASGRARVEIVRDGRALTLTVPLR